MLEVAEIMLGAVILFNEVISVCEMGEPSAHCALRQICPGEVKARQWGVMTKPFDFTSWSLDSPPLVFASTSRISSLHLLYLQVKVIQCILVLDTRHFMLRQGSRIIYG